MDYSMYPSNLTRMSVYVIQGDTYNTNLSINTSSTNISSITFICKELNVSKTYTYISDLGKYTMKIPAAETAEFPVGRYSFDITINFTNGDVLTKVYNGELSVYKKTNIIGE